MASSREPKYTTEDKREALELGEKIGPTKAARRLDLPTGTLTCRMYKARQAAARGEEWPESLVRPAGVEKGTVRSFQVLATYHYVFRTSVTRLSSVNRRKTASS